MVFMRVINRWVQEKEDVKREVGTLDFSVRTRIGALWVVTKVFRFPLRPAKSEYLPKNM